MWRSWRMSKKVGRAVKKGGWWKRWCMWFGDAREGGGWVRECNGGEIYSTGEIVGREGGIELRDHRGIDCMESNKWRTRENRSELSDHWRWRMDGARMYITFWQFVGNQMGIKAKKTLTWELQIKSWWIWPTQSTFRPGRYKLITCVITLYFKIAGNIPCVKSFRHLNYLIIISLHSRIQLLHEITSSSNLCGRSLS